MIISETVKSGVVVKTRGEKAWVRIDCGEEACNGCHISGICGTQTYTPTLAARIENGLAVKTGDEVMLMGRVKGWLKGWIMLAGLPCAAILAGLVLGSMFELKDGLTGAIALGFVIMYYIMLWLMRGRVDRNVEWIVESVKGGYRTE